MPKLFYSEVKEKEKKARQIPTVRETLIFI